MHPKQSEGGETMRMKYWYFREKDYGDGDESGAKKRMRACRCGHACETNNEQIQSTCEKKRGERIQGGMEGRLDKKFKDEGRWNAK